MKHKIFSNDDAWILAFTNPPLTPDKMWEDMIKPHIGSPIKGFMWSVGGHDIWDFETNIGERSDQAYSNSKDKSQKTRGDNLSFLIKNYGGPMEVITDLCKKANIKFYPSVRMNEHYDIDIDDPSFSKFRKNNPEYLIGWNEINAEPSMEWGVSTGLNYAINHVRNYMSSIILELAERWDIDGIELDFMRHPTFFKISESNSNHYLMTDMITGIRNRMNQIGKERNKHLDLIVRVPPTLSDCKRIGLNINTWVTDKLIDVVVAGGGMIPFEMPIQEFCNLTKGTETSVYGCLEALHPHGTDTNILNAISCRYYQAGVDGIYLFNFYSMSKEWKKEVLEPISDINLLKKTNKIYATDDRNRFQPESKLHFSFLNAIKRTQIPVVIDSTHHTAGVPIYMDIPEYFDKMEETKTNLEIRFLFERIGSDGLGSISVNKHELKLDDATITNGLEMGNYDAKWNIYPSKTITTITEGKVYSFTIAPETLRFGENIIRIKSNETNISKPATLKINKIQVQITHS